MGMFDFVGSFFQQIQYVKIQLGMVWWYTITHPFLGRGMVCGYGFTTLIIYMGPFWTVVLDDQNEHEATIEI